MAAENTGAMRVRRIVVMLVAVVVVCLGTYYAWATLFSTDAGGTSVLDTPVHLDEANSVQSGDHISDSVARSTFKSFVLSMSRKDSTAACSFASYKGKPVSGGNDWKACLTRVEETVSSLSAVELAALQDGLRTATYTTTPATGSAVTVSTVVVGQTFTGTVVTSGGMALVDLESIGHR